MKLYELADQLRTLESVLESDFAETDEEKQSVKEALDNATMAFVDKLEAVAKVRANLLAEAEGIHAEMERLDKRMKSINKKTGWLKDYIEWAMKESNQLKVKTPLFSFSIQNNAPRVEIEDPSLIDRQFCQWIPEEYRPNKVAIAEALKAGIEVPGAVLVPSASLRIR